MQKYFFSSATSLLGLYTGLAGLSLFPINALADNINSTPGELVVTPSRTDEPAQAALTNTTIVTREQIAAAPTADLGQLLARYTTLDVVRSGGPGQNTSVFMRGANSNQTLLLIDGVPVNNGLLGGAEYQYLLSPDEIDHIEIVRGPRSTLYGSGAVGGVINIITRRAHSNDTEILGSVGNEHTYTSTVRQNIHSGSFYASAALGNNNTQGYPLLYPAAENTQLASGNFARHGSANAGWNGDNWHLDAAYQQQMGHTQSQDAFKTPVQERLDQDFYESLSTLKLDVQPTPFWDSTLNASRNIDSTSQRQSLSPFYTGQNRIDWQNNLNLPAHLQVVAGSTYTDQHNQFMANNLSSNTFNTWANYLQNTWNWHHLTLVWAGRYEASDVWGNHLTQEASVDYQIGHSSHVYFTRDTAFRAPTSEELYSPATWGGNPDLKPETSLNYEAGIKNQWQSWTVNMAIYRQLVSNLIAPVGADYLLENINNALLRGVETTIGYTMGSWKLNSELDIQRSTDMETLQDLVNRPRRIWSSTFAYTKNQWSTGINWHTANSSMAYGSIPLAGYGVVDLNVSWKTLSWLTLQLGIDNVANRVYAQTANSSTQYYLAQPRLYTFGFAAKL